MYFRLNNTFTDQLQGDPDLTNKPRQVYLSDYSFVTPQQPSYPQLVHVCDEVAELLEISGQDIDTPEFLGIFSGAKNIVEAEPYAMCYGGHQFGNWAGQLGDGRAINLAQVDTSDGNNWTLQLKGAGATPYSRTADGLAVLRSSIREHLCSEAMFHLGVPTTRSLSLSLTGDKVVRDVLYDGNPDVEKGAVVCRVAPSFIRFGNFEIHAARGEVDLIGKLADYTIDQYFPEIDADENNKYVQLFGKVCDATLEMVIGWQRVGFVHGVMNTDNMSILGLTIDCLLYTSPSPRDATLSRMPSSA